MSQVKLPTAKSNRQVLNRKSLSNSFGERTIVVGDLTSRQFDFSCQWVGMLARYLWGLLAEFWMGGMDVLSSGVARNFRQGVRQSVAFLSVHSRSAAVPSWPITLRNHIPKNCVFSWRGAYAPYATCMAMPLVLRAAVSAYFYARLSCRHCQAFAANLMFFRQIN